MKLSEAKAVITGGASGLGFATAQRVIDEGGQVVLLDINDALGAESAEKLGDRASYVSTDVSNEDSVKAAVLKAKETMGGITLAVNCAGVANAGRALGREGPWPTENFNRVIQINLVGTFNVTKESAAIMNENEPSEDGERGVIISTASIAAFEGQTPMMAGMSEEVQASLANQVPFPKRLGHPEEYANTVAFIYETTYVNSETIRCDGAIRMQAK